MLMPDIEEFVTRRYLAERGLVAIDRALAEDMAKLDGGVGANLMVYDAKFDRYVAAKEK